MRLYSVSEISRKGTVYTLRAGRKDEDLKHAENFHYVKSNANLWRQGAPVASSVITDLQ